MLLTLEETSSVTRATATQLAPHRTLISVGPLTFISKFDNYDKKCLTAIFNIKT